MFLKRLEVIGFKSFAERIGIDFVPGVTAVVGPNGSGKSNVTDAIRWVLGEQSAKSLRGAKMEDVIFAGSESRKPLNFAEVTLILDNEDERIPFSYTEVSVTRRVYRSGDSEYLLNNQQCRLKDITDLFMDSGLGKEAFSIISQGRVDEILNSKPDDRRSIFEEAAGVLKYKLRKKKAEHKLVETDENLHRVLDILHELDVRLEPLHKQASSAKDYLAMTEELKDHDIALIVHDIDKNKEALQQFSSEYSQLSSEEQRYATELAALEQQMMTIRHQLTQLDTTLDKSQQHLVEASTEVERWEGRKALMAEKRQNATNQLEKLQQSLEQAKLLVQQLTEQEVEKKQLFAMKQQEVQQIREEIKQLELSLSRSANDIEQEIEHYKNKYIDCLNEEATIKNELKNIEQQLAQQRQTTEKMTDRSAEIEQELEIMHLQKKQAEHTLQEIENVLSVKLQDCALLEVQWKQANASLDDKQNMLYKAYQHQQQLKARKDTLAELESEFSGFFQGVKEVLLARDKGELVGIVGAVAELLQVRPEYSQAIETALGAASQHIVTETEQHAQKAIGYLKQKRAGRATFLPKTVMKSRKLQLSTIQHVIDHPAFIQMADVLVTFDESNKTIVENLLGNVLVAKDLQGASEIARLCQFKYRVVTLDGDIVNAGGSLTGGALKQQSSLFTRKAELESLVAKLQELQSSIVTAEQSVATSKTNVANLRDELEQLKLDNEQLRVQQLECSAKVREYETIEKTLTARISLTSTEQTDATMREQQLLEKRLAATERRNELTLELEHLQAHVNDLTTLKVHSETEKDLLREQSAERKSALAVAKEQLTQLQIATADIALNVIKANKQMESISREIAWTTSEGLSGPSKEEIDIKLAEWLQQKNQLSTHIQENRVKRATYQQELTTKEQQLKELQRVYKGYVEALQSLEIKRSRYRFEMEKLLQELEELYQLDYDEIAATVEQIDDEAFVRRKVKLLKQSIEELGSVNMSAIEEYERVQERHTFLTEQRNDLLAAQETLHEAIKEMDTEMTMRFSESFYAIREQFKRVFRELFGGGQADLLLIDSENMLETGIDIFAQPPGKKLQNLSLLSGGERALTAIALLFAILNTRPVPFCILDEVESALDEANVTRYSEYLKKCSSQTQFIVITHRKGTMEGADVLYGITMQESGVSKLVSVKFEDHPIEV